MALVAYAGAALPSGFCLILINIYLLKFSTDVLAIEAAVIGKLLLVSRIWDAAADPAVGMISDRTRTRWGRRRPWVALGALPMALGFAGIFAAPATLESAALALCMGGALFLFFTGFTLVDVPHASLGAELSTEYHQRTRVFAWRRAAFGLGSLAAVGALQAMESAAEPREIARTVAIAGAVLVSALVGASALGTRERAAYQGRGGASMRAALRDVLGNPHARRILGVYAFQQTGVATLAAALPYLSEYVLGTADWTAFYLLALFASSLAGVPLWLRLSPRMEKRTAVLASMGGVLAAIAALAAAPPGGVAYVMTLAAVGGLCAAGMDVLGPSLQADIVDWDELCTGERKEGAYFAALAFAQKSAAGLGLLLTAEGLGWIEFVPNAVQTPQGVLGLRGIAGGLPALLFGAGMWVFWGFRLTASEHARIRSRIDLGNA